MTFFDVRSVVLPYCLKQHEDGSWIFLNREYKPIGFCTDRFITYEQYPVRLHLERLTTTVRLELDVAAGRDSDQIFLYDDGCVPTNSTAHMRAYLNRLAVLSKLKVDDTSVARGEGLAALTDVEKFLAGFKKRKSRKV